MKFFILFFSLFLCLPAYAGESIYLSCYGIASDRESQVVSKQNVKNDLLINKERKTISLIITGFTKEETPQYEYEETTTQFISKDGSIAINKMTLEYSVTTIFSNITGTCIIQESKL